MTDFSRAELDDILNLSARLKGKLKGGVQEPALAGKTLAGDVLLLAPGDAIARATSIAPVSNSPVPRNPAGLTPGTL